MMNRITMIPPIDDPMAIPATCPEPILAWELWVAVAACTVDDEVLVGRDVLEELLVDKAVGRSND